LEVHLRGSVWKHALLWAPILIGFTSGSYWLMHPVGNDRYVAAGGFVCMSVVGIPLFAVFQSFLLNVVIDTDGVRHAILDGLGLKLAWADVGRISRWGLAYAILPKGWPWSAFVIPGCPGGRGLSLPAKWLLANRVGVEEKVRTMLDDPSIEWPEQAKKLLSMYLPR
jgi:hypothetical protein